MIKIGKKERYYMGKEDINALILPSADRPFHPLSIFLHQIWRMRWRKMLLNQQNQDMQKEIYCLQKRIPKKGGMFTFVFYFILFFFTSPIRFPLRYQAENIKVKVLMCFRYLLDIKLFSYSYDIVQLLYINYFTPLAAVANS